MFIFLQVFVFNSLRKPIKITMLGNDAREYEFIVKFGEDLRLDQRIQQLSSLANHILQKDVQCFQRSLGIQTYSVIPLTHTCGLIQYVSHTKGLRSFILDVMNDKEVEEYSKVQKEYDSWLRQAPKCTRNNMQSRYLFDACRAYDRDHTVARYREFVNRIPHDILRYEVIL